MDDKTLDVIELSNYRQPTVAIVKTNSPPIDGAAVLTAIVRELQRFLVLEEHARLAVALWVMHTHATEAAFIAPILAVESPEKRCGKSTMLTLLRALVRSGRYTSNITPAALFREIDMYRPTLLIDEADLSVDRNNALRNILNAGHSRATSTVIRVEQGLPKEYDCFGPKAIAGIGVRADTIRDRAIRITLHRKLPTERVELLRQDALDYAELQQRVAQWAESNLAALKGADPQMPRKLNDRAMDNWRPLLAIADLCGAADGARQAAAAIAADSGDEDDDDSATELLTDVRGIFEQEGCERIASKELATRLAQLEDRPWSGWNNGRPIDQAQVARLLARFRVRPKVLRIKGAPTRGYERDRQLAEMFNRYVR